jgi:multiple sugar transport system permease protein
MATGLKNLDSRPSPAINKFKTRKFKQGTFAPYFFILPSLVVVLIMLVYPVLRTFYLSFTDAEGLAPNSFIGLANYIKLINDPVISRTMVNVALWTITSFLLPILIGLFIAVTVSGIRYSAIYRTIFLLPYVFSGVAIGSLYINVWETKGILNQTLTTFGLEQFARSWLLEWPYNTFAMIIATTWGVTGLAMVLYTVGLQNIPQSTIEAGTLDGAGPWRLFRSVIWPQLAYINAVVIGTTLANSLRTFDVVWTMTQGGPARSSETLAVTMYRETFLINRPGYGSTIAVLLMVLVLTVSVVALRRSFKAEKS